MTVYEREAFEEKVSRIFNERICSPANSRHYECEKCKDTGFFPTADENGREILRKCTCTEVKRVMELAERSGISTEFRKKSLNDFDTRNIPQLIRAKNKAVRYLEAFENIERQRRNSIMFYGQPGSGKTHLGTAISNALMNRGIAVVYMAYRNAVTRIKQNMLDEAEYTKEVGRYMKARVLYIDDMLKGKLTDADVNIMYEIVNYRYMNYLPIIISTEKDLAGMMEFDEAIASRLVEMSRENMAKLQGEDLNYRLYLQGKGGSGDGEIRNKAFHGGTGNRK